MKFEAPEEKSFEILNNFPIQMHREADLTLPLRGQMSMYDHYFSNFGRPVAYDLRKDSATRHLLYWRKDFKRFLPYMGMAAILVNGQQPF